MTGYRCEELFGEGRRDAASVMAHEIFVLEDTDILDYLIKSDLIGETMKELLFVYKTLMKEGRLIYTGFDTDYEEMLYRPQECLDSHNIDQARYLKEFEFDMYDTSDIGSEQ